MIQNNNYDEVIFSSKDLDNFIKLSNDNYENKNPVCDFEHIKWKHCESPNKSFIYYYIFNKKKVGRIVFVQKKIIDYKKTIHAYNPCDLLIDKRYRKNPLNFINLINGPRRLRNKLIIHTSNENSERLYKNLLKFPIGFELTTYFYGINILNLINKKLFNPLKYFLKLIINIIFTLTNLYQSINICKTNINETNFKNIITPQKFILFERNQKIYDWRTKLYKKQNIFFFTINDKQKKQIGYLLFIKTKWRSKNFMVLLDFFINQNLSFIDKIKIRLFILLIYYGSGNCLSLISFANKDNFVSKIIHGFPFFKVPNLFLPHKSPFFIRNFTNKKFNNMHTTLFDIDYF